MISINLHKSELISLVKNIVEEVELEYDEMDYFSAFFDIFKDWLKKNVPENEWTYPVGYLLKKYQTRFLKELIGDDEEYDDDYEISRWEIETIVKKIIEKGRHTLPSLYKQEKFTEKYKKSINYILNSFTLPPWAKIEIEENNPNFVNVSLVIDFPKFMKDMSDIDKPNSVPRKLIKSFEDYLGIETGNPTYGFVKFSSNPIELINVEEWIKNELTKIKKEVKKIPGSDILKSIRFYPEESIPTLQLVFNRSNWEYNKRKDLKDKIKTLVENMGYNSNRLKISMT